MENEKFSFDVDSAAIGKPVWVKISYFPNWHVQGADGPYLASPSFMMVIPTQTHVTLTYGRTGANTIGQVLEVIAWILLLALSVWRTILWRRRRRLAGAGSAVIPVHDFTDQYLDRPEQRYDAAIGTWVAAESADGLERLRSRPMATPPSGRRPPGPYDVEDADTTDESYGAGPGGNDEPGDKPPASRAAVAQATAAGRTAPSGMPDSQGTAVWHRPHP